MADVFIGMSFRAARACEFFVCTYGAMLTVILVILSSDSEPWENEGFLAFPESLNRDWHFWSAFAQGGFTNNALSPRVLC